MTILEEGVMRIFLVANAVLAALFANPALAADIPLKAPPLPPPAVFSWTGFYGGANVGYSWGNSSNTWNIFAANLGGATACPPASGALCVAGTDSNHMNGVIGGLQIGYNWQTGRYVFGIETDFDATGQRGNQTFNGANGAFLGGVIAPAPTAAAYTEKLSWLGTLRGRVGIASDHTLFYATGGLAYGEVKNTGSATISGSTTGAGPCTAALPAFGTCPLGNWSNSADKTGWTIGGGVEQAFAGNWSVKVEYLYVDLGRVNTTFATLPGCFGGPGGAGCSLVRPGSGTISSRITDNIVRLGLNYKFSGPAVAQ
jgi:outer membrane immunogenic protein